MCTVDPATGILRELNANDSALAEESRAAPSWFDQDPETRSIAPGSAIHMSDWLQGEERSLAEIEAHAPHQPLALAVLACRYVQEAHDAERAALCAQTACFATSFQRCLIRLMLRRGTPVCAAYWSGSVPKPERP